MFEVREDLTVCGLYLVGDEWYPIYCDQEGMCHYEDDCGAWTIAELSVENPLEIRMDKLMSALEKGVFGECVGVVYTSDGRVYVFKDDDTCAVRKIPNMKQDVNKFFYTVCDYED